MDTYHWDVLVKYHWDVVGCFIWDFFETSWRRTDGTSLLCPFETSLRCPSKTSWRRTTETLWWRSIKTLLGVSFGTYLRHRWEGQWDVVTTSPRRLNAGWVQCWIFIKISDVPQRFILDPLFFLIHINNLSNNIIALAIKQSYVYAHVCSFIKETWIEDPQIQLKMCFLISFVCKIDKFPTFSVAVCELWF